MTKKQLIKELEIYLVAATNKMMPFNGKIFGTILEGLKNNKEEVIFLDKPMKIYRIENEFELQDKALDIYEKHLIMFFDKFSLDDHAECLMQAANNLHLLDNHNWKNNINVFRDIMISINFIIDAKNKKETYQKIMEVAIIKSIFDFVDLSKKQLDKALDNLKNGIMEVTINHKKHFILPILNPYDLQGLAYSVFMKLRKFFNDFTRQEHSDCLEKALNNLNLLDTKKEWTKKNGVFYDIVGNSIYTIKDAEKNIESPTLNTVK